MQMRVAIAFELRLRLVKLQMHPMNRSHRPLFISPSTKHQQVFEARNQKDTCILTASEHLALFHDWLHGLQPAQWCVCMCADMSSRETLRTLHFTKIIQFLSCSELLPCSILPSATTTAISDDLLGSFPLASPRTRAPVSLLGCRACLSCCSCTSRALRYRAKLTRSILPSSLLSSPLLVWSPIVLVADLPCASSLLAALAPATGVDVVSAPFSEVPLDAELPVATARASSLQPVTAVSRWAHIFEG